MMSASSGEEEMMRPPCMPLHTSHLLQPLDAGYRLLVKRACDDAVSVLAYNSISYVNGDPLNWRLKRLAATPPVPVLRVWIGHFAVVIHLCYVRNRKVIVLHSTSMREQNSCMLCYVSSLLDRRRKSPTQFTPIKNYIDFTIHTVRENHTYMITCIWKMIQL